MIETISINLCTINSNFISFLSIFRYFYLYIYLSNYLSIIYVSIYLLLLLSIYLPIYICIYLTIFLSINWNRISLQYTIQSEQISFYTAVLYHTQSCTTHTHTPTQRSSRKVWLKITTLVNLFPFSLPF